MPQLFSRRKAQPASTLRYDLPQEARARIWAIIKAHVGSYSNTLSIFLNDLEGFLRRQYGILSTGKSRQPVDSPPALVHFAFCSDDHALDFIEACFRVLHGALDQNTVDEINEAFVEEGIGYELTPYRGGAQHPHGTLVFGGTWSESDLPQIIRRDHQLLHENVVRPALQILASPLFAVANDEMLKAHASLRSGNYEDAITLSCSAFESVLKTVCTHKKWPFNPDRDTCQQLVLICRTNGLFPPFYETILSSVAAIRNRLGDAHGRGPTRATQVSKDHANHAVRLASTNILLLAALAGLG